MPNRAREGGWQIKKLGEVLKLEYGKPLPKDKRKSEGRYPAYGANGIKSYSTDFFYDKPSIIVGRKGSAGELNLTEKKFWPLDVTYFVTFEEGKYDLQFLYYLLTTLDLTSLAKGVKPGINRNEVYDLEVRVPLLSEQIRVVNLLGYFFSKISLAEQNAEKNLQNTRELFESYLQKILTNSNKGWEEKKLVDVCTLKSGTTISKKLEKPSGEILYTKVGDMNLEGNEVSMTTSSRFVDRKDIRDAQIIPVGSIIFPKRGGAIFTNKKRKIIKPTIVDLNTMAVMPSKTIDEDFLYFWFKRINLTDLNNGSSIPQINNYSFDNVYIAYPKSLAEQRDIVARLDSLSVETKKLEAIYAQKLADLEELRKSILKKAFSGEL